MVKFIGKDSYQFLLNKKLSGRVVGKIIWDNKYKAPEVCLAHSRYSINGQVCLDLSAQKMQFSELVLAHCSQSRSSGTFPFPLPVLEEVVLQFQRT